MADWREQLRTASFRGIEFLYSGAGSDGNGRRLVIHQYPTRDTVDIEDNGANARRFSVSGYLLASSLGAAFWPTRDRLEAAFNQAGAGSLVHPYYGAIDVYIESAPLTYSTRNGGMVQFEISCVRASAEQPLPKATTDTRAALTNRTNELLYVTADTFAVAYSTVRQPEFVRRAIGRVLMAAATALGLSGVINVALAAYGIAESLLAGRDTLSRQGATRIAAAQVFGDAQAAADAGVPMGSITRLGSVEGNTPTAVRMRTNQTAVARFVRIIGIAAGIDRVVQVPFASFDDAIATRDALLARIDHELLQTDTIETIEATGAAEAADALVAVRDALIVDVEMRAGPLARLTHYTPRRTLPAVVLGWTLYASADRGDEIVMRNAVSNPTFVPGGELLEVLDA